MRRAGDIVLRWRGEGVAEIAEVVGGAEVKVADRAAAEKLTNTRLYVDRAQLPEPEDDEFYLADLIGLAAVDADGAPLGTVGAVHDYGAGASLEIDAGTRPPLLVPFTAGRVPAVDLAAQRVVVEPPEVGSCFKMTSRPLREGAGRAGRTASPLPPAPLPHRERAAHELARLRADAVPGDVSRAAGAFAGRPGAAVRDLVAGPVDIRDFAGDRHRTVDDTPFGGGAGMVMRPDVVDAAVGVRRR